MNIPLGGTIKKVFNRIDGIALTQGLRDMYDPTKLAMLRRTMRAAGGIATETGRDIAANYAFGMGRAAGSAILRNAGYGAAAGAVYGALDEDTSILGGVLRGAVMGGVGTGIYSTARSTGIAIRALRGL